MREKLSWLVLLGLIISFNTTAHANAAPTRSLIERETLSRRCSNIFDEWECDGTRGCYWNNREHYCESDDGGGGGYRRCHDIYSPLECSNDPNCYWSTSQRRCMSNNGGGGARRCYYIRDPYECNASYNCHWSRAYDRCVGPDDI